MIELLENNKTYEKRYISSFSFLVFSAISAFLSSIRLCFSVCRDDSISWFTITGMATTATAAMLVQMIVVIFFIILGRSYKYNFSLASSQDLIKTTVSSDFVFGKVSKFFLVCAHCRTDCCLIDCGVNSSFSL